MVYAEGALCVVALMVAVVDCAARAAPTGPTRPEPPAPAFVDADPHGAVLFRPREGAYLGIRRDGSVAWRVPADRAVGSCLTRCPDAALIAPGGATRRVLTAVGADDLVASAGDGKGLWWLEIRHGPVVTRVPVGGAGTSWQESPDGRHALAISPAVASSGSAVSGNTARWFDRDDRGWQPAGPATPVPAVAACVDPGGSWALLVGERPAVFDRAGTRTPVTDLDRAGACALARGGGIVVGEGDGRSAVRVLGPAAATTRRADLPRAATVTADPVTSRVAYVTDDTLVEVDSNTGATLRTGTGILAARYDGAGGLVVLRADGAVHWLAAI